MPELRLTVSASAPPSITVSSLILPERSIFTSVATYDVEPTL